jgi:hypothetical protein
MQREQILPATRFGGDMAGERAVADFFKRMIAFVNIGRRVQKTAQVLCLSAGSATFCVEAIYCKP